MGAIQFGIPKEIALLIKDVLGIQNFIETGTYHGATARWASDHFSRVYTIEASHKLWVQTSTKFKQVKNIEFLYGNTRELLPQLVQQISEPTLFWLDAHWSGGVTYGVDDECPLLEEIAILNNTSFAKALMIDDARLFNLPPPQPHRLEQWPSLDQVIAALNQDESKCYTVLSDDCFISIPYDYRPQIAAYFQDQVTTKLKQEVTVLQRLNWRFEKLVSSLGLTRS